MRRLNSYLLVDEAVNIMRYDFEVLENLLLQGREFGVGVMLSSQFLSHFRTSKKNWAEPLLTWFIHKVPHVSVKDLERIGLAATEELADQIGTLPVHEAVYKSLGVSGRRIRGNPFYELVDPTDADVLDSPASFVERSHSDGTHPVLFSSTRRQSAPFNRGRCGWHVLTSEDGHVLFQLSAYGTDDRRSEKK